MTAMSDTSDWLRYVTDRTVTYLTTPAEREARKERKSRREPWLARWFGLMGMQLWWQAKKNQAWLQARKKDKPHAPGS